MANGSKTGCSCGHPLIYSNIGYLLVAVLHIWNTYFFGVFIYFVLSCMNLSLLVCAHSHFLGVSALYHYFEHVATADGSSKLWKFLHQQDWGLIDKVFAYLAMLFNLGLVYESCLHHDVVGAIVCFSSLLLWRSGDVARLKGSFFILFFLFFFLYFLLPLIVVFTSLLLLFISIFLFPVFFLPTKRFWHF